MKKSLLSALLMVLSVVAFAKNDKEKDKEKKSNVAYYAHELVGAENVIWTKSAKFKKASYIKDGARMTAFYNWQNQLIATTQIVEVTELPAKAIQNLVKYFPDNKMGEIVRYKNEETVFFVNLTNEKEDFIVKVDESNNVSYFKKLK
ncbi:MAG: hypothetical protein ACO1O1_13030 [Adhaeribacter sp.]